MTSTGTDRKNSTTTVLAHRIGAMGEPRGAEHQAEDPREDDGDRRGLERVGQARQQVVLPDLRGQERRPLGRLEVAVYAQLVEDEGDERRDEDPADDPDEAVAGACLGTRGVEEEGGAHRFTDSRFDR